MPVNIKMSKATPLLNIQNNNFVCLPDNIPLTHQIIFQNSSNKENITAATVMMHIRYTENN